MRYSATKLRADLYRVLDRVLKTGIPVEVERKARVLKIVAVEPDDKIENLTPHPEYLLGDAESMVHLDWSGEWRP